MNSGIAHREPNTPFQGWKILALATFSQFVSIGFTVFLLGLFIDPMAQAFNAGRGDIGWGAAIFYAGMALMGPLLGIWVDRGKVRLVMTLGAVMLALGLALMSQATTLLQAGLICALLIAPGASMIGVVPATAMVIQWFNRRRGLAVGICIAGLSLGGFFVPPFTAWLMSVSDWRISLLVLGAVVALILVPATWLVAVAKPADIGQFPDGEMPEVEIKATDQQSQKAASGYADLLRNRIFWTLALTMGALSFSGVTMSTYLIPFSNERGLLLQTSALMFSVVTGSAFIAKFAAGWLCDRFQPANILTAITVSATLSWLPMLNFNGIIALIVSAAIAGFSTGSLTPVAANLIARQFGADAYGRVQGAIGPVTLIFLVVPGPLGGYLYDSQGSYASSFATLWWVLPISILASLSIPRRK